MLKGIKHCSLFVAFLACSEFFLAGVSSGSVAQTSFVCKDRIDGHDFQVRVNAELKDQIEIRASLPLHQHSFRILSDYWDNDKTGLVSASNCFVTYENHHGCIRNVKVTGNFLKHIETLYFESCGGYHQGCDS